MHAVRPCRQNSVGKLKWGNRNEREWGTDTDRVGSREEKGDEGVAEGGGRFKERGIGDTCRGYITGGTWGTYRR